MIIDKELFNEDNPEDELTTELPVESKVLVMHNGGFEMAFLMFNLGTDFDNIKVSDLVYVEMYETNTGNRLCRPVACYDNDDSIKNMISNGFFEDTVELVIKPMSSWAMREVDDVINDYERISRAVNISTSEDDDEAVELLIDTEIYATIDENADKRYFGINVNTDAIVELEAVEHEIEQFVEKDSVEDEEENEPKTFSEVIAIVYDIESVEYINNHFSIVDSKFTPIVATDIVYTYTISEMERNEIPSTIYELVQ